MENSGEIYGLILQAKFLDKIGYLSKAGQAVKSGVFRNDSLTGEAICLRRESQ